MQRYHSPAFTLVELLVVIAIIGLLAAILFPVLSTARENARRIACLSNTKQLALGVLMYAQDSDETLPPVARGVDPNVCVVARSVAALREKQQCSRLPQ